MARSAGTQSQLQITVEQRRWLQRLAAGVTLQRLATEEGYSLRHLQRLIADLYRALGVGSRSQAVALAALAGIVTVDDILAGPRISRSGAAPTTRRNGR